MDFTRQSKSPLPINDVPLFVGLPELGTINDLKHGVNTVVADLTLDTEDTTMAEFFKSTQGVLKFIEGAEAFGIGGSMIAGAARSAENEINSIIAEGPGVYPIGHPLYAYEAMMEREQTFNIARMKAAMSDKSFSGVDITPTLNLPGQGPYIFGDIHTMSFSSHRESFPARILGRSNPIGFTRGPRTIGGTIIFSLLDMYPWYKAVRDADHPVWTNSHSYPLADSLPPFDITLSFHNELEEHGCVMRLFGVVLIDDGMTVSIDDMVTENTYSFMAAGIAPVHNVTAWNIERGLESIEYGIGDAFANGTVDRIISTGEEIADKITPPWLLTSTKPARN